MLISKSLLNKMENNFYNFCDCTEECFFCPYEDSGHSQEECLNAYKAEKLNDYIRTNADEFKLLKDVDPIKKDTYQNLKSNIDKNKLKLVLDLGILQLIFIIIGLLLLETINLGILRLGLESVFIICNYEYAKFKAFKDVMMDGEGAAAFVSVHNSKVDMINNILENKIKSYEKKA